MISIFRTNGRYKIFKWLFLDLDRMPTNTQVALAIVKWYKNTYPNDKKYLDLVDVVIYNNVFLNRIKYAKVDLYWSYTLNLIWPEISRKLSFIYINCFLQAFLLLLLIKNKIRYNERYISLIIYSHAFVSLLVKEVIVFIRRLHGDMTSE